MWIFLQLCCLTCSGSSVSFQDNAGQDAILKTLHHLENKTDQEIPGVKVGTWVRAHPKRSTFFQFRINLPLY